MSRNAVSVFVSGQHSGVISRSDRELDTFLFSYDPKCPVDRAVSLTMPVTADQYDSMGVIHPIFEMNLPEGQLRHKLELMFSKVIPDFDSLSLLEIIGKSQIGHLRSASQGDVPEDVPAESVNRLLSYDGAGDLFGELLDRFAKYSGVSGMQPKVLIRDDAQPMERITSKGATHIVKSFDPKEFPELAANEYFSMKAAEHAGLPAAKTRLSANRSMLIVDRFDLNEKGMYLGFEDFCVLSGMRSGGRYNSSYEILARRVKTFVSPQHRKQAMEQLFGTVALACMIKNGDAHLKNFGVLYDSPTEEVRLAPVYDMLSTKPYMPQDVLALELGGSKKYPNRKELLNFGLLSCDLKNKVASEILDRVANGVGMAAKDIESYAADHPDFARPAEHFIRIFTQELQ